MEGFLNMVNAQLVLFIYLTTGIYCFKMNLIDSYTKQKLVDFILKISLPCMIFNSFNKPLTSEILQKTALVFRELQDIHPQSEEYPLTDSVHLAKSNVYPAL